MESPILRYPSFPHPLTALRFNQITGISSLSPLPHTLELDMTISKGTAWQNLFAITRFFLIYFTITGSLHRDSTVHDDDNDTLFKRQHNTKRNTSRKGRSCGCPYTNDSLK